MLVLRFLYYGFKAFGQQSLTDLILMEWGQSRFGKGNTQKDT